MPGARRLFGVVAADPATFAVVTFVVLSVAVGACLMPARRAIRVSPIESISAE